MTLNPKSPQNRPQTPENAQKQASEPPPQQALKPPERPQNMPQTPKKASKIIHGFFGSPRKGLKTGLRPPKRPQTGLRPHKQASEPPK